MNFLDSHRMISGARDPARPIATPSQIAAPYAQLAIIPLLYFAGVKLSLASAVMPEVLVMLWLPNGLLLATLIHFGFRRFIPFACAVVAAEIAADLPHFSVTEAILFGLNNLLEVSVAYSLLRLWRFDPRFAQPSDIAKFLFAGPIVASVLTACAAGGIYTVFRDTETSYFNFARIWWFSDGVGLLIMTPLTLSLWPGARRDGERPALHWYDVVAAILAVLVLGVFLFSDRGYIAGVHIRPVQLLIFTTYFAARLTPRVTIWMVAGFSAFILYLAKQGQQPFGNLSTGETVIQVQQLILIMTVASLALTSLLAQLRATARTLERRVEERTVELQIANERLRQLAVTDPLTGLPNRRALTELLLREMERHRRHRHELAVVIFDIDHFKSTNDGYGHHAGDEVLRRIASETLTAIRSTERIARYGGEEFVLVALETDGEQAMQLAERLREAIRAIPFVFGQQSLRVTASFGVATLAATDVLPEDLIGRADKALYAAKLAGRDRVMFESRNEPEEGHTSIS